MKRSVFCSCGLILLILLTLFACKKSSNSNPFADAIIATASVSSGGVTEQYTFFYDMYHNLDSVSISSNASSGGQIGYLKYTYIGSSWSVTDENGNSFMVYANTNDQVLKVLIPDTLYYNYSNNLLASLTQYLTITTPPYYVDNVTNYTWKDGDLASTQSGAQTSTYTYNTGKNGQPGDAIRIKGLLYDGVSPIKTTHLPTALAISATQGINYAYTFDSRGRISTLVEDTYDHTLNTHDTTTYAYTYDN